MFSTPGCWPDHKAEMTNTQNWTQGMSLVPGDEMDLHKGIKAGKKLKNIALHFDLFLGLVPFLWILFSLWPVLCDEIYLYM